MNKLENARLRINKVDGELAKLFEERMKAVEDVVAYKMENDLAIFDPTREKEIIEKNLMLVGDVILKPYFKKYLEAVMTISKEYQMQIMNNSKEER